MKILVKYFANYREITNTEEEEFNLKKESVIEDLLNKIIEKHPELTEELFDGEKLSDYTNVLVNHRNIEDVEGLKTSLGKEDTVAVFPPVSGG